MQNTIELLYNGDVYPPEQMIPKNKAYRGKCRDNGELKEVFANNLSDAMKADFKVIILNYLDMTSLETEQTFVDGFQLGTRLMLEILEVATMSELEYVEIDGLLYPTFETGLEEKENELSKYGIMRLRYLHEHKREIYRELLLTGKLAAHCKAIDTAAFEQSEQIQAHG